MLPFLLLLLQTQSADLVVTGKRLVEAQTACVRGGCTPLRDAQASIALAESQFREGAYLEAKRTLAAAAARNAGHAATDPRPVAAIYEALATVALHEGDQRVYKRAVADQVRTLRDNLPADDPAVSAAAVALGDMWIKLRNYRQAEIEFRSIEKQALQAGLARGAMLAGMKRAWLASAVGEQARAMRLLDELVTRPIASDPAFGTALRVLRVRIGAREANDAEMAKLAGELGQGQGSGPVLIWAPPLDPDPTAAANYAARKFGDPDIFTVASSEADGVQWIDVGFWIRPDGHTAEAEILRSSHAHPWSAGVLNQIAGRQYSVSGSDNHASEGEGTYRIERVTRRSRYMTPNGSLVVRRVRDDGLEILDLTQAAGRPAS
jgi:tetratricopeptide (TPR) repeat protein